MKFIIMFLFLSFAAFANYIPKNMVGDCSQKTVYVKASKCPGECIRIPSPYFCQYHEIVAETVMKEDVEACVDEAECQSILASKICSTPQARTIYTLEPNEVYCTWVRPEQVLVNASLKGTYESEKTVEDAQNAAVSQAKLNMECGRNVQALLVVRNAAKNLTTTQVKQVIQTYSIIKQLLDSGSLNTAKEEIQAVTPDGTLVTEEDKTALINKIDECLGL